MGVLITGRLVADSHGGRPGRYAEALAAHPAGRPITCCGCGMLAVGCDIARQADGAAAWCDMFPLRRAGYFAETRERRHARAAVAGIALPPE